MRTYCILLFAAGILAAVPNSQSAVTGLDWIDKNTNLTFYGDLRLRYELDWDSQTATGTPREDRNRGRIRARFGFNYRLSDEWSAGARVRTGSSRSQQSPHLTFVSDDHIRDSTDFVFDRYFIQFKHDGFSSWGGSESLAFLATDRAFLGRRRNAHGVGRLIRRPPRRGEPHNHGRGLLPSGWR